MSRDIYTQPLFSTYKIFLKSLNLVFFLITLIFANLTNVSIIINKAFYCCQPIMSVIF